MRKGISIFFLSITLASGVFISSITFFKGNLLILSGPLALWVGIVSLPKEPKEELAKQHKKSRRIRKNTNPQQNILSLRILITTLVWALAVAALWAIINQPAEAISDAQIDKAMKDAAALFKEGKYDEALARFWSVQIPEFFPNRLAQKYHNIGLIQLKLNKTKQAEAALQKAVFYDPKDFDAYYLLIRLAYESEQYSEALKYLNQAKLQLREGESLPDKFCFFEDNLKNLNKQP